MDLSYAELMQCVGVENFLHSWDDALDTFPLAAHCGLPDPPAKESDKVWLKKEENKTFDEMCKYIVNVKNVSRNILYY